MKKIFALFLLVALGLMMVSCGATNESDTSTVDNLVESLNEIEEVVSSDVPATNVSEEKPVESGTSSGLDAEFKAAMDSYEEFMNEYVTFMKKYKANPGDLSILSEYANYMSKYAEFVEDFEKWNDEEMNAAETAYYIEVQSRVNQKLLEVAQ